MADRTLLGDDQPVLDWWADAAQLKGITPFEAKALYAVGMTRHLAEGGIRCLRDVGSTQEDPGGQMELPAYVLVADAIEALGRCLTGSRDESGKSQERLKKGLNYLLKLDTTHIGSPIAGKGGEFFDPTGGEDEARRYDVDACVKLRNFTTHGGTTPSLGQKLDRELTCLLLDKLGGGLSKYWNSLAQEKEQRDRLAEASIRPLHGPLHGGGIGAVFVEDMYNHIVTQGHAAGDGIRRPEP